MAVDTLLLELGAEELPPTALDALSDAFAAGIEKGLQEAEIPFQAVTAYATPRAPVDGEGARVAREGPRRAPRGAHGARRRVRLAARRTRDARFAVDGACRVPRRAYICSRAQ